MLCIDHPHTEAYFNLALEEYLLKNKEENIFMLWRNNNAIIVGKHQNTLAEINTENVKEREIKVVRRLTGGGAVYHDLGNLNFTFIMGYDEDQAQIDFKKYTQPIIDVMADLGIKAEFSGRNDLLIDGKKFSGNAEHIYHQKKRVLHHGTLLFASEITDISNALNVNPLKFEGKAMKSVRSRVTNISSHLPQPLSVEEFRTKVMAHIVATNADTKPYQLDTEELNAVQELATEKYETWDWNYGYSPKYGLKNGIKTEGGHVEVHFNVAKGLISGVNIYGDFFVNKDIDSLKEALVGVAHREAAIEEKLTQMEAASYFNNISVQDLVKAFF